MDKDEVLELETRRGIYDLVLARPGVHFREIKRELDLPTGALEYHLHFLEDHGLLTSRMEGRYKRFYVTGEMEPRDKEVLGLLRQEMPRRVLTYLMLHPCSTHKRILRSFDVAPSTLSFHLKKLVEADLVMGVPVGRQTEYEVVDDARVARLLIQYRESFADEAVDSFADTWLQLNPELDVGGEETADTETDEGEDGGEGLDD